MFKIPILLLFFALNTELVSQGSWFRTFGGSQGDNASSVIETSDYGYIISGSTDSYGNGGYNYRLIKVDSLGRALWSRTYGGDGRDEAYSVVETSDGGFAISGKTSFYDSPPYYAWLVRTTSDGDTLWTRKYGETSITASYSIIQSIDGGFVMAGYTFHDPSQADRWIIKTDSLGVVEWTYSIVTAGIDYARSVVQCEDESILVAGFSIQNQGITGWLLNLNSVGELIWSETFPDSRLHTVVAVGDNAYIAAGELDYDPFVVKVDISGQTYWERTYTEDGLTEIRCATMSQDEGYVFLGRGYAEDSDFHLMKTNTQGDILWSRLIDYSIEDSPAGVVQVREGGYIVAGTIKPGLGIQTDVFVAKTDSLGFVDFGSVSVKEAFANTPTPQLLIYPNPVNGTCRFTFTLFDESSVSANIFNINGTSVWSYNYADLQSGTYKKVWDAKNRNGIDVDSGVYILKLSTDVWLKSQKLIIIK